MFANIELCFNGETVVALCAKTFSDFAFYSQSCREFTLVCMYKINIEFLRTLLLKTKPKSNNI